MLLKPMAAAAVYKQELIMPSLVPGVLLLIILMVDSMIYGEQLGL